MTREIKENDRKMWRNVWKISRKLQGLFLTLSVPVRISKRRIRGFPARYEGMER